MSRSTSVEDVSCGVVPVHRAFSLPGATEPESASVGWEIGDRESLQRDLGQQQARHLERVEQLLREQEDRLVVALVSHLHSAGVVAPPKGMPSTLGSVFSTPSLGQSTAKVNADRVDALSQDSRTCIAREEPGISSQSSNATRCGNRKSFMTDVIGWKRSRTKLIEGHASKLRNWARWVHRHRHFEASMAVVIMLSAVALGWQTDWSVKNIGQVQPMSFTVTECIVNLACTLELVVRLVDESWQFFDPTSRNFSWNLFDSIIILSSWGEDLIRIASLNVSALRIARLLRLARILRIVRVMRFFRDLRLMVQGILVSLKPLVWCITLLLIIMFCAGMVILQVMISELTDNPGADHTTLLTYFGGILATMYTLYMSMTGGVDWGDPADELRKIHPLMVVMYSSFIAFSVLCMLNIITGVFVENANTITKADADNMVMEELSAQEKRLDEMKQLFELAAGPGADKLQEHQFVEFIHQKKVQAYFSKIGLNVEKDNARALFRLIDIKGNGSIGVSEFVDGCAQFIGAARQLDIARLRHEIRRVAELMDGFIGHMHHTQTSTFS